MRSIAALVLLLVAGCASSRQLFRPRERAVAEAPSGMTAAEYPLGKEGRQGELRIWSDGAYPDDHQRTILHVGFEIESAGPGPLALDLEHTDIEGIESTEHERLGIDPATVHGDPSVPAGAMGRIDLEFPLAAKVAPRDIESFAIHWRVRDDHGGSFEQITPFIEERPARPTYRSWSFPFFWSYGGYGAYWGGPYCW